MDGQGVEKAILFPTLGVGVEGLMSRNPRMAYKVFAAFNSWLNEDWGYSYQDRIYAAPYIPVLDPDFAVVELKRVLDQGARVVALRPGPANGRSPADPIWDPFWSIVNEAKVLIAYHGYAGPDQYDDAMNILWERQKVTDLGYQDTLRRALRDSRPVLDTFIALVLGNLFGRFPNVRIASIENGCAWVDYCLHVLDHAGTLLERRICPPSIRLWMLAPLRSSGKGFTCRRSPRKTCSASSTRLARLKCCSARIGLIRRGTYNLATTSPVSRAWTITRSSSLCGTMRSKCLLDAGDARTPRPTQVIR